MRSDPFDTRTQRLVDRVRGTVQLGRFFGIAATAGQQRATKLSIGDESKIAMASRPAYSLVADRAKQLDRLSQTTACSGVVALDDLKISKVAENPAGQ